MLRKCLCVCLFVFRVGVFLMARKTVANRNNINLDDFVGKIIASHHAFPRNCTTYVTRNDPGIDAGQELNPR